MILAVVHGMGQVDERLCQGDPVKSLWEEVKQGESLESEIVRQIDEIAMLLLTGQGYNEDYPLPHLRGWAKHILLEPDISQEPAVKLDSGGREEWSLAKALAERLNLRCQIDSHQALAVFARIVANLPRVKRQGWLNHKIR
jgi:hypothetical protein